MNSLVCFNCTVKGHRSIECNKDKALCKTCGNEGHLQQYCEKVTELAKAREGKKKKSRGPATANNANVDDEDHEMEFPSIEKQSTSDAPRGSVATANHGFDEYWDKVVRATTKRGSGRSSANTARVTPDYLVSVFCLDQLIYESDNQRDININEGNDPSSSKCDEPVSQIFFQKSPVDQEGKNNLPSRADEKVILDSPKPCKFHEWANKSYPNLLIKNRDILDLADDGYGVMYNKNDSIDEEWAEYYRAYISKSSTCDELCVECVSDLISQFPTEIECDDLIMGASESDIFQFICGSCDANHGISDIHQERKICYHRFEESDLFESSHESIARWACVAERATKHIAVVYERKRVVIREFNEKMMIVALQHQHSSNYRSSILPAFDKAMKSAHEIQQSAVIEISDRSVVKDRSPNIVKKTVNEAAHACALARSVMANLDFIHDTFKELLRPRKKRKQDKDKGGSVHVYKICVPNTARTLFSMHQRLIAYHKRAIERNTIISRTTNIYIEYSSGGYQVLEGIASFSFEMEYEEEQGIRDIMQYPLRVIKNNISSIAEVIKTVEICWDCPTNYLLDLNLPIWDQIQDTHDHHESSQFSEGESA